MPLQATSGAASYDAFGGGVAAVPQYIEDVFSTYLYTGNGSTQTINNGIDLAGEGGLVWLKSRTGAYNNYLIPTPNGSGWGYSNTTDAFVGVGGSTFTFNNNGWTTTATGVGVNALGENYASWTFRKQPKFFDVVTWVGDGTGNTPRTISHNLGSTPGFFVVKKVTAGGTEWICYHRSLGATKFLRLNDTPAAATNSTVFGNTEPTSTTITVGGSSLNDSGNTFVAYLFAHDAGGFGLTGTDNVISCGSITLDGSNYTTVDLGYEPQWVLIKNATTTSSSAWEICDNMRGMPATSGENYLLANSSAAEGTGGYNLVRPTSTGFSANSSAGTYIYIAIRRGPMKVPTSGTSVFVPAIGNNSTSAGGEIFTTNFPVDFFMRKVRATTDFAPFAYSRLTAGKYLVTGTTAAEATDTSTWFDTNTGIDYQYASNFSGQIGWLFQRAPSFFDVVCYTGTGSARTVNHNLGVAPEMMIVKSRDTLRNWDVYHSALGATKWVPLNLTNAAITNIQPWNNTEPTASVFTVGVAGDVNASAVNYVAYLFATCAGVSKVGSYTGTGTTLQVNCGFTGGARFVLIKRTDSTGSWYVWDVARGISSGNDPYLLLNSTAAEVTNTDYIDTYSAGFEISSTAPSEINASGGTFIFLAIA